MERELISKKKSIFNHRITESLSKFNETISMNSIVTHTNISLFHFDDLENESTINETNLNIDEKEIRIIKFLEDLNIVMVSPILKQDEYFQKIKEKALELKSPKKGLSLDQSNLMTRRKSLQKLTDTSLSTTSDNLSFSSEFKNTKCSSNSPINSFIEEEIWKRKKSFFSKNEEEGFRNGNNKITTIHTNEEFDIFSQKNI